MEHHTRNDVPGSTLRALRRGRGWSLRYVAELASHTGAELTYSAIHRIESNRGFTKQSLDILAEVYQVPLSMLFLPPELAALAELPLSTRNRFAEQIAEMAALYRRNKPELPS